MHEFSELVLYSTAFSLNALDTAQHVVLDELENRASTPLIKVVQMIQLQKNISAVGMFSMFEAVLQEKLECADGFRAANELLESHKKISLRERFVELQQAINVLKHGKGRSYDALVAKADSLPFRIKRPGEYFFDEGHVSEIAALVEVDDEFVLLCAEIITAVSDFIQKACHNDRV